MNSTSVDFGQPSIGWLDEMWGQLDDTTSEDQAVEENLAEQCGLTDESKLASTYASHYLLPLFEPPMGLSIPLDKRLRKCLPEDFCKTNHLVPLAVQDHSLEVAIASPSALLLADDVRRMSGLQMRPLFARATVVRQACEQLFDEPAATPDEDETKPSSSADKNSADRKAGSTKKKRSGKASGKSQQSHASPSPVAVPSPMNLTAYDLKDAERAAWQRQLVADSGLTVHCGRKSLDKSPLARLWGVWAAQTHGRPACRWNALQRESMDSDPSVVVISDLKDRTSAEVALHAVLQGQRVFAVVHARDPVSAILRLRAWGQIGHLLAEQINLLIHQDGLSRSDCGTIEIDDTRRSALASENDMGRLQKLFPSSGTFLCGP